MIKQLQALMGFMVSLIESLPEPVPVARTIDGCAECEHFRDQDGHCAHWRALVPADAQAAGCDQFQDRIPF